MWCLQALSARHPRADTLRTGINAIGLVNVEVSGRTPYFRMKCQRTKKNPVDVNQPGVFHFKSLTMSYFHTGTRTIIGAKSFHCPVRNGKEWYQLAMVIRHNCLINCPRNNQSNS